MAASVDIARLASTALKNLEGSDESNLTIKKTNAFLEGGGEEKKYKQNSDSELTRGFSDDTISTAFYNSDDEEGAAERGRGGGETDEEYGKQNARLSTNDSEIFSKATIPLVPIPEGEKKEKQEEEKKKNDNEKPIVSSLSASFSSFLQPFSFFGKKGEENKEKSNEEKEQEEEELNRDQAYARGDETTGVLSAPPPPPPAVPSFYPEGYTPHQGIATMPVNMHASSYTAAYLPTPFPHRHVPLPPAVGVARPSTLACVPHVGTVAISEEPAFIPWQIPDVKVDGPEIFPAMIRQNGPSKERSLPTKETIVSYNGTWRLVIPSVPPPSSYGGISGTCQTLPSVHHTTQFSALPNQNQQPTSSLPPPPAPPSAAHAVPPSSFSVPPSSPPNGNFSYPAGYNGGYHNTLHNTNIPYNNTIANFNFHATHAHSPVLFGSSGSFTSIFNLGGPATYPLPVTYSFPSEENDAEKEEKKKQIESNQKKQSEKNEKKQTPPVIKSTSIKKIKEKDIFLKKSNYPSNYPEVRKVTPKQPKAITTIKKLLAPLWNNSTQ